jgi:molybdate transport system regulatory protein
VKECKRGAVNDEVHLELPGGARIVAIVTHESAERLGLKAGVAAVALVKASSVIVATELDGVRLSTRNQLAGTVVSARPGAVNAEVVIDIGGGATVAAIVTQPSLQSLALKPGSKATAIFKASSVILGTGN